MPKCQSCLIRNNRTVTKSTTRVTLITDHPSYLKWTTLRTFQCLKWKVQTLASMTMVLVHVLIPSRLSLGAAGQLNSTLATYLQLIRMLHTIQYTRHPGLLAPTPTICGTRVVSRLNQPPQPVILRCRVRRARLLLSKLTRNRKPSYLTLRGLVRCPIKAILARLSRQEIPAVH